MLRDRLQELSQTDVTMAHELAREAARNDSLQTIEVRDNYVVVEKTKFKGTHKITETERGWDVSEHGKYKVLFDDIDLTFPVHAIDDTIHDEIQSELQAEMATGEDDEDDTDTTPETEADADATPVTSPAQPETQPQSAATASASSPGTESTTAYTAKSTATPNATLIDKVRQLFGL